MAGGNLNVARSTAKRLDGSDKMLSVLDEQSDDAAPSTDKQRLLTKAPSLVLHNRVDTTMSTGFVADSVERVRGSDGSIQTRDGQPVSILSKALVEGVATFIFLFFAKLGSVNAGGTDINFFSAVCFSAALYVTLRSCPGVTVNSWLTLNNWFFMHKARNAPKPNRDHFVHHFEETVVVILMQQLFGFLAVCAIDLIQGEDDSLLGATLPTDRVTHVGYVILYEGAASFLFCTLIQMFSNPRRFVAAAEQAVFISVALFFVVLCFAPFTGASVNLANTLSSALVRSIFHGEVFPISVLYYIIGQAVGFSLAGLLGMLVNTTGALKFMQLTLTQPKTA